MRHIPDFEHKPEQKKQWWRSREGVALLLVLGFALVYLVTEHTSHLSSYLPWLILLACPLMHVFMHHGKGHGPKNHTENGD